MFIIEETEIAKAIEAAKKLHPIVRMLSFGEYTCTGSTGNTYTVKCYRNEQGQKVIDCSCKTRDGVACKHGMAVVGLHIYMAAVQMVIRRRAARIQRQQQQRAVAATLAKPSDSTWRTREHVRGIRI
ncbi:MAG: hypothetical protein WCF57_09355 [Pyrinomonadaceae bacterium]